MRDTTIVPANEPDGAPRIAVLDILRGIAILGILFMNINDMGGAIWAMFGHPSHFGWTRVDRIAWWLREVFANGTARCMLEMLFGAGMVILTTRAAATLDRRRVMRGYYRRNIILYGFGLAHMLILLWPGDILHTYAIAALLAFWFRRLRPRWLIMIGLISGVSQLFGAGYFAYYAPLQQRAAVATLQARRDAGQTLTPADGMVLAKARASDAKRAEAKAETTAKVAAEDKARTGTFATWTIFQWGAVKYLQTSGLELLFIWEALSVMLIGAALFKLGILQGARSRGFYVRMMLAGYAVGFVLRIVGAVEQMRFDDAPKMMWATTEIARQAMTIGHLGAVNLLVGTVLGAKLLSPFVAAGRTALSIYICQTIICLWILYPPFGLRLYGTMGWAQLMAAALVIDIVLLVAANVYIRHFDIAPVEWAWRSLVERRRLPWRKPRPADVTGTLSPA